MKWKKLSNMSVVPVSEIPVLPLDELRQNIIDQVRSEEKRVLGFFSQKEGKSFRLYALLCDDATSRVLIAAAKMNSTKNEYLSITSDIPAMHLFERELFEDTGIRPAGHPWLKPVRYSVNRADQELQMSKYPFYSMSGEQIHEVAVGPVHAGVIEPGHFRFMCHGETVYHLEIQLGYQHRNMEEMLLHSVNRNGDRISFNPHLAEKIAGDTVVGHSLAYAGLMEVLSGAECPSKAQMIRSIALELERMAVHIGDLGAVLNDIGFMMGSAVFGALRTTVINTSLAICGSRFSMGFILPGGVNYDIQPTLAKTIQKNLNSVEKKLTELVNLTIMKQTSVLNRLERTGILPLESARAIGMVGPAARASGLPTDVRINHPFGNYKRYPTRIIILEQGDVFARTYIRYVETLQSIRYIREQLDALEGNGIRTDFLPVFSPGTFAVSMTEGWRGEIVHAGITDAKGKLVRYKIKDPSFNNWYGLQLAVRDNGISDFPLCNKSFNLSYCGHDL